MAHTYENDACVECSHVLAGLYSLSTGKLTHSWNDLISLGYIISDGFVAEGQELNIDGRLVLPHSMTVIYAEAFYGCENLTCIEIPVETTSIKIAAFYGCMNLNTIIFKGTTDQWEAIAKSDEWYVSIPAKKVICSDGSVPIR